MLEKQKGLDSTSVSQTMTEIEILLCRRKVSNTLENEPINQQPDYSDIPPELIEFLRNPSIRALLTPPTQLEIEVKEMVEGKRDAPAKYPVGKGIKKPMPVEFLKTYYRQYLDEGCIFLDDLRVIDKALVRAMKNYDANNSTSTSAIVKRERERVDFFVKNLNNSILEKITSIGSIMATRKRMNIKPPTKNQN